MVIRRNLYPNILLSLITWRYWVGSWSHMSTYRINIYWPIYSISHNKLCTLFWNCRFLKFWNSVKLNIDILNWYLIKGMPSKKKLWTFPKSKLGFQNNNFGPKNHQNFLKNSMDIHGWPTYLLKICPNFFSGKNMASTDPTYLWFGLCPKFCSFLIASLRLIVNVLNSVLFLTHLWT